MVQLIVIVILSVYMIVQSLVVNEVIADILYIDILGGKNIYIDILSGLTASWGIIFGVLGIIFSCLDYFYLYKKHEENHESTRLKVFIAYIVLSILILI